MNIYETSFTAECPNNGVTINYRLKIETDKLVMVEDLQKHLDSIRQGFHEHIADDLHSKFGGRQTLAAYHHGVYITTLR